MVQQRILPPGLQISEEMDMATIQGRVLLLVLVGIVILGPGKDLSRKHSCVQGGQIVKGSHPRPGGLRTRGRKVRAGQSGGVICGLW